MASPELTRNSIRTAIFCIFLFISTLRKYTELRVSGPVVKKRQGFTISPPRLDHGLAYPVKSGNPQQTPSPFVAVRTHRPQPPVPVPETSPSPVRPPPFHCSRAAATQPAPAVRPDEYSALPQRRK